LNANARAVNEKLIERLAEIVPAGDLFLSRTMEDAQVFSRTIVRRGYGQVFLGGGDGTLVTTMNLLRQTAHKEALAMPTVGVLKLGTGNAMARSLGAGDPIVDANHVVQKGPQGSQPVQFVETEDGELTPFAGMGYDGIVLNDYVALKKSAHKNPIAKKLVESVWGYLGAMLFKSVPSQLKAKPPHVKITSSSDAYLMVATDKGDVEQLVPAGTVLFEGPAPIVSVGAIPFYGYGFTMLPFAGTKAGYMQLRVGSIPIPVILANLYPSIWKGRFRYATLKDFLVKDVCIESDTALPYQVGGDARGQKRAIRCKVSEQPVQMIELGTRLVPQGHTILQLGPARVLLRLPR
jgi:diacylglycerol kinase family enzyme